LFIKILKLTGIFLPLWWVVDVIFVGRLRTGYSHACGLVNASVACSRTLKN